MAMYAPKLGGIGGVGEIRKMSIPTGKLVVIASYGITYHEDDLPDRFLDEDGNIVATYEELRYWAQEKYAADVIDLVTNSRVYAGDVFIKMRRQGEGRDD